MPRYDFQTRDERGGRSVIRYVQTDQLAIDNSHLIMDNEQGSPVRIAEIREHDERVIIDTL